MNNVIATAKELSARLIACGVSPDTADMCLSTRIRRCDGSFIAKKHQTTNLWTGYPCHRTTSGDEELENIPAWSLGRLLSDVLPKHLDNFPFKKWYPPFDEDWEIERKTLIEEINGDVKLHFFAGLWFVDYTWDGFSGRVPQSANPIEAVVLAIELLHANGYKFSIPKTQITDERQCKDGRHES